MLRQLLIFILLLAAQGALAKQPAVLVLGDSLSAAYGIDVDQGWVNLLQQRLAKLYPDYRVINASVSGDTSRTGFNRLGTALKRYQPTVVIVELGGNDALRGLSFTEIETNLTGIIELSQQHGAKVLLTGLRLPPNYGPRYNGHLDELFQRLADKWEVALVPRLLNNVDDRSELMQADGIHPDAAAQPLILDNVWPRLQPML
jgi:acyl-CoA thioesterase I